MIAKKVVIYIKNDPFRSELIHEINLSEKDGWKMSECTVEEDYDENDDVVHKFTVTYTRHISDDI